MSVTIIILEGDGATPSPSADNAVARKKLKDRMPESVREALDAAGRDIEMESGEQIRRKLPKGFPDEFVVPEEVLVFPEEEEDVKKKKTRKRINVMRNNIARKNQPGNTEP